MGFLRSDIRWLLYLESYSEPGLERVVLGHLGRCQALILSLLAVVYQPDFTTSH